ncbi:MAG: hypothetical protein EBT63_07185 [Proteobacteria bacterium]|nr:hypothetical protein [Pseudomonadota bacterium]NCA29027.1 hypothetical protein [Pseudomonadota bacterium]
MKNVIKLFPITSWALFANIIYVILYFADIDEVSLIYNFIGIDSASFYKVLDILRKIILWPVFWEMLLFEPRYGNDGEWLIPQYDIKYELPIFLFLDLTIFYLRKKLVPILKSKFCNKSNKSNLS